MAVKRVKQSPGHQFDGEKCLRCGSEKTVHQAIPICERCARETFAEFLNRLANKIRGQKKGE
jgi:hypothetical protein